MRYLPCIINADDGGDKEHMQKLAEHTARVRAGRAYSFTFRVDGWEVLGIPWEPNQMVPIRDPVLGYEWEDLLIVSTNATVDRNNADVTDIVVAPKEGYEQLPLPEPENDSGGAKRGRKKRSCKYGLGSDGNCKRKGRRKS
jgi:prophage tail gpP-like protein